MDLHKRTAVLVYIPAREQPLETLVLESKSARLVDHKRFPTFELFDLALFASSQDVMWGKQAFSEFEVSSLIQTGQPSLSQHHGCSFLNVCVKASSGTWWHSEELASLQGWIEKTLPLSRISSESVWWYLLGCFRRSAPTPSQATWMLFSKFFVNFVSWVLFSSFVFVSSLRVLLVSVYLNSLVQLLFCLHAIS